MKQLALIIFAFALIAFTARAAEGIRLADMDRHFQTAMAEADVIAAEVAALADRPATLTRAMEGADRLRPTNSEIFEAFEASPAEMAAWLARVHHPLAVYAWVECLDKGTKIHIDEALAVALSEPVRVVGYWGAEWTILTGLNTVFQRETWGSMLLRQASAEVLAERLLSRFVD